MTRRALLALGLVLAASPARADDEADKRAATALVENGAKLLAKGDLDGALDLFHRAYATYPSPKIFLDLGTTEKKMGRTADAANDYQRYLDQANPPADRKTEVGKILVELDKGLATITIAVTPADGTEVRVAGGDWRPLGDLAKWRVLPGDVLVEARHDGDQPGKQVVKLGKGASTAVSITLVAIAVAKPPPPPVPAPIRTSRPPDLPTSQPPRFAVTARALVDGKLRGGGGSIGGAFAIGAVDVEAAAIIAAHDYGGYAGASLDLMHGALRPRLAAGVPFYVSSGARFAARAAAGATWRASTHLGVLAEVGVEYYVNPEPGIDKLQVVPVLGVQGWL